MVKWETFRCKRMRGIDSIGCRRWSSGSRIKKMMMKVCMLRSKRRRMTTVEIKRRRKTDTTRTNKKHLQNSTLTPSLLQRDSRHYSKRISAR